MPRNLVAFLQVFSLDLTEIIIRVSGVRVPPPASHKGLATRSSSPFRCEDSVRILAR
jgi:hypothetical protein